MLDPTKCTKWVHYGSFRGRQCSRKIWKDGFCKTHHPDSVKARREKSDQRYKEQEKQMPWYRLQEALKVIRQQEQRIAELEAQIASLSPNE